MDFALNEEQRMFQKMFRDFVTNEVAPLAEETDQEEKLPPLQTRPIKNITLVGRKDKTEKNGE